MKRLVKGFGFAFRGIWFALSEHNMRIHFVAIVIVTAGGIYLGLSATEWSVIALTIGMVITAEMMNTAIEDLVDLVSPEFNKKAGRIKDISAGGVLIAAIVATFVAVYIFGNKIFNLLF